jgi:hypothetical protein
MKTVKPAAEKAAPAPPSAKRLQRPRAITEPWVWLRVRVGSSALGHRALASLPRADPRMWVGEETDVCLEGFPRSGNTFAYATFHRWNPDATIAHHVHVPAQLTAAAKRGIPAALLIREPVSTVASLMVYWESQLSAWTALRTYIDFHRSIEPILDRLVVCPFDRFIDRPRYVVDALNDRYRTRFSCEEVDQPGRKAILEQIQGGQKGYGRREATLSVPNDSLKGARDRAAEAVKSQPRLDEAMALYRRIAAAAP